MIAGFLYCLFYALGWVGLASSGFTWEHFAQVFEEGHFLKALLYSTYQALLGTALSLLFAFILFYFLLKNTEKKDGGNWWPLYVPLLMPPIVVAFAFFGFWSNSGWMARLLQAMHLIAEPSDMVNLVNGKAGIAILMAHIFLAVPFFTINLFNIYKTRGMSAYRALSFSLGANVRNTVRRVEVPVLLRAMKRVVFLYFIFMFGAYEIPLLLGAESSRMLSLVVLDKLTRFDVLAKPQAYAMASMYLVLAATMVFLLFSTSKNKAFAQQ